VAWRIGVGPGGEWAFKDMTLTASVKESFGRNGGRYGKAVWSVGELFSGNCLSGNLRSLWAFAGAAGQAVEEGPST